MRLDPASLFSVRGRTALITGGTSGIGRMMAEGMVDAGAQVIIAARSGSDCDEMASSLSQRGICLSAPADVSSIRGIRQLAQQVQAHVDRLDILVNCAGLFKIQELEQHDEQLWDDTVDLNLKAPFFLTQLLLPLLRKAAAPDAPARIVNIGSGHGLRTPSIASYSYAASKAGLHHLTRVLAGRLAAEHITVNAIAPGVFPSRLTADFSDDAKAAITKGVPLGRYGMPEDIVGALLYLTSRAGAYVTATILTVDGGWAGGH